MLGLRKPKLTNPNDHILTVWAQPHKIELPKPTWMTTHWLSKPKLTNPELWNIKLNEHTQTVWAQAYKFQATKAQVEWPYMDCASPAHKSWATKAQIGWPNQSCPSPISQNPNDHTLTLWAQAYKNLATKSQVEWPFTDCVCQTYKILSCKCSSWMTKHWPHKPKVTNP